MRRVLLFLLVVLTTGCEKPLMFVGMRPVTHSATSVPVYVLAGQSNMVGAATDLYPETKRVLMLYGENRGPGYPFGQDITTGQVVLVQCAVGGTSIDEWDPSSSLYQTCLSHTRSALAGDRYLAGVLFYQGEQDAVNTVPISWAPKFTTIVNAFRADLGRQVPIVYAQVGQVALAPNLLHIQDEQKSVSMFRVSMVQTADLPTIDGTHHTSAANIELGQRFAQAMKGLGLGD
jgi:hypothetical protein